MLLIMTFLFTILYSSSNLVDYAVDHDFFIYHTLYYIRPAI